MKEQDDMAVPVLEFYLELMLPRISGRTNRIIR
jgi:hypothetical protein